MNNNANSNATTKEQSLFVKGVDAMRFWSALWVVLYHGARFPITQVVPGPFGERLDNINKPPFNGVAAVVVFFIISGFCIHYPYVGARELNWLEFWCKRMIRILIPFFALQLITHRLGLGYSTAVEMVFWTIYCEISYYVGYPFIRLVIVRFGMMPCIFTSFLISLAIAIAHYKMTFIGDLSQTSWIFCLPMWLLGCQLAEYLKRGNSPKTIVSLWAWRLGALAISSSSMVVAHTHPAIGYIWTMPAFAIYASRWLHREFITATNSASAIWIERLGVAGYSIYLTHKISIHWAEQQYLTHHPWYWVWPAECAGLILITLTFFGLVEYPAHRLSKFVGKKLSANMGAATRLDLPIIEQASERPIKKPLVINELNSPSE